MWKRGSITAGICRSEASEMGKDCFRNKRPLKVISKIDSGEMSYRWGLRLGNKCFERDWCMLDR